MTDARSVAIVFRRARGRWTAHVGHDLTHIGVGHAGTSVKLFVPKPGSRSTDIWPKLCLDNLSHHTRRPSSSPYPAPGNTARDDPLVSGNVRKCPEYVRTMPGYARICPMMSRCRDCPATALRDASGPTIRLSRAAGRAVMKRHGVQAKICSQTAVGGVGYRRLLGRGMAG